MTKPGFYRKVEGEPPSLGRLLSPVELLNLDAGTEIVLHSHLHGDRFQSIIVHANNHEIPIIRGRRDGKLGLSDLLVTHDGHNDERNIPVAVNHVITLGITRESGGRTGREKGYKLGKRHRELPPFLLRDPVKRRNGRR